MPKVLVADDEYGICEAFSAFLSAEGHEPLIASSGREAVQLVRDEQPAVVFLDVQMPGGDGLTALQEIVAMVPELPVIVMTAYGTLETAKRSIDLGAFDYLGKPVELEQIRAMLARALHKPGKTQAAVPEESRHEEATLLGQSAPMQELFKKMALLASNDLSILIQGESGVGKELVARGIHSLGANAAEPFVAVNCAAIPDTLIEAELFGNEPGAFTDAKGKRIGRFEAAGKGTLFLDEVSELPFHLQSKLLRVLQERTFERLGSVRPIRFTARLIAASNQSLEERVRAGQFREDLFHRLNLACLQVPALRDRQSDIELLTRHFLGQANEEIGKSVTGVEPDAFARLCAYDWPGNVRELEHCIKRAVLAARGRTITVHDLDLPDATADRVTGDIDEALMRQAKVLVDDPALLGGNGAIYQNYMDRAGIRLIEAALRKTGGNQVAAARLLGINRSTLRKKLADKA
jgi:DNA-binding NtrC family response regulator